MISEDEGSRRDVAVSLTYDSSPESSLLVPRKSSTPAVSGVRQSRLSPFSPDKKVSLTPRPLQKLSKRLTCVSQTSSPMDSLREEMKEKDALITSMNEQLKSLQVRTYEDFNHRILILAVTHVMAIKTDKFSILNFISLFSRLKCRH